MAIMNSVSFNRLLVYAATRVLPAPLRNPLLRVFLGARGAYFGQYLDFRGRLSFGRRVFVGKGTIIKTDASIGDETKIGRRVTIEDLEVRGGKAVIGAGVTVGDECVLDSTGGLKIGDEARLSREVIIYTHEHRGKRIELAPVEVKRGATIGARAIVLRGVVVGEKSVVGAGAVVTKSVRGGATAVGVPAKEI